MHTTTLCGLFALLLVALAPAVGRGDEGEQVYKDICTKCHDAGNHPLDDKRLSRQQWKEQVERMEGLGADVPSGKKLNALLDYLERTHSPASAGEQKQ